MPSVQETAYPRLKSNITPKELAAIYTPTPDELDFVQRVTTTNHATRLGFLILLKAFQRLGYAVSTQDVPPSIIAHLSALMKLSVANRSLEQYDTSATRKRHLKLIRDYLQLRPYEKAAETVLEEAIRQAAFTKQDLADLINVAIEELIRQRFELPAFSTLKRKAREIRTAVTDMFYQQVNERLSKTECQQIDALLTVQPDTATTAWHDLKQDPGRPTQSQLKFWMQRLQQLSQLQWGQAALLNIPAAKVKHFAEEAVTLDAYEMKRMGAAKRYALVVALLDRQYAQTLDDLAEMFVKQMQQLHHKGRAALQEYRNETQSRTDNLIATLRDMLLAYQQDGDIPDRFAAIAAVIGEHSATLLHQCEAHLSHTGNNYFPLLQNFYKHYRATLFQLLQVLPLRSSTQDSSLIEAIQFLVQHQQYRKAALPIVQVENPGMETETRQSLLDLNWIPLKWWSLVTGQRSRTPQPETVHRRHFEVCVFSHILLELKSGDLYVEGSSEYGDYYSQLISWEEYQDTLEEYGKQVELPTDSNAFVTHVQQ